MPKKKTEEKQISINKFEKFISPIVPFPLALDEETQILIKPRLNFTESVSFIDSVVNGVLDYDTVSYNIKDFITRVVTFEMFTNIRLPEDYEKKYEFVYGVITSDGTDLYERIINHLDFNTELYKTHLMAIDKQIDFEVAKIHSTFRTETQEFISKIESECEQVMTLFNAFSDAFKDINPDQMGKILAKIPEMENFSEKSLAEAVLEAQSKEDGEVNAGI